MTLVPVIFYQGTCHKCQKAYYYPGGDGFAKPDDKRPLECVLCGYPVKKVEDPYLHRDEMIVEALSEMEAEK